MAELTTTPFPLPSPQDGGVDLLVVAAEHSADQHAARAVRELAALKPGLAERAEAPQPSPQRTAETDRAYLDVQQTTRRLIAKGSASEVEMAALEMQIAELPAEQRRQALSAISRAISNGSLDARF